MTRLLLFLVHNWPLKLAAIMLATLLYGVIVITQDSQQIAVNVPITGENQPPDVVVVSNLGEVRDIRYLAADGVPVNSSSFRAFVDFQGVQPETGSIVLGVTVERIDPRVSVVAWEPRQIIVSIDQRVSRAGVPIEIVRDGELPSGFEMREPELEVESVEIRGASADVARVQRVQAHVQVQPTSLDIDRQLDLTPVDAEGEPVPQVDVEPASIRVRIAVLENGRRRTVPVRLVTTGDPAPGFEIAEVRIEPDLVTIEGDGEQVIATTRVDTVPLSLTGLTDGVDQTVQLALPPDVLAVGGAEVEVTITLRSVTSTRAFAAGVVLDGARSDRSYDPSVPSVTVTVGGSPPDLDRLEGRTFTVEAPVAGLDSGTHQVTLRVDLPAGLTLVAISPPTITVVVAEPATGPSASAPAASP
jgi:YbbR domain-containing protein